MRKPPTGEPYAGKPPVRFGGRGRRKSIPTPIPGTLRPSRRDAMSGLLQNRTTTSRPLSSLSRCSMPIRRSITRSLNCVNTPERAHPALWTLKLGCQPQLQSHSLGCKVLYRRRPALADGAGCPSDDESTNVIRIFFLVFDGEHHIQRCGGGWCIRGEKYA